jgi:hypothetical protein
MGGLDVRVKQGFVAAALAIVLLVLTAAPASASEKVLTPTVWGPHGNTTVRATLGIEHIFGDDYRAFVKYRKDSGGSGSFTITVQSLKLFRDGVVVKSTSGGPFGITTSWQYFRTGVIGAAGICGTLRATASIVFKHSDGHSTTRSLATSNLSC